MQANLKEQKTLNVLLCETGDLEITIGTGAQTTTGRRNCLALELVKTRGSGAGAVRFSALFFAG